jgi:regulator of sirC expression with transglutaminase-like and TPR domain
VKKILLLLAASALISFTPEKISVLYKSIDPTSISAHLAFYQLFPDSYEGKKALEDAWKLLSGSASHEPLTYIPQGSIDSIVTLVTKAEGVETLSLKPEDLHAIEQLAKHLPNRKLKGHYAASEEEVLKLPFHEVDLSRGLLLAQAENDQGLKDKLNAYEALMDLMALQILTKVPLTASPQEKIREINHFIFQEMGYRFPPHSVYAKDIDLYTYLPTVIDSRRGVCLGVSILYLSLSQRLDLPLEAMTPPGHIYVRYNTPQETRNIETTARGIHLDTKEYLGIETETIPIRNIKDVIGLAYFNEASVHWQNEKYEKALKCYQKALLYLPEDLLLQELMGFNYLFVGEKEKGDALIAKVFHSENSSDQVSQKAVLEDYINGKVDSEGIRSIFLHVDEKRESLLRKKTQLEETIAKWPEFRACYFHLGVLLLQLHRVGEALTILNQYVALEKNDPTAEYLMAELNAVRSNFPKAWQHLNRAKELTRTRNPTPESLKDLHRQLSLHSPE